MFTTLRSSSLRSRQSAMLRDLDRQLLADQALLARGIGLLVSHAARPGASGERVLPNTRASREALSAAVWTQVLRPYYLGPTGEALQGAAPQSPYARLLVAGVRQEVQTQVEWHQTLIRRYASERVFQWLTGPRPLPRAIRETMLDSFSQWVDPRGFRLADRIQRMAVEVRARVNRFFDYHAGQATPAPLVAEAADRFLTTGERGPRPYGTHAITPARVLLLHEATVAGSAATQNLSRANPFVRAIQWVLSPRHAVTDRCDVHAAGGPEGDGVYSFELVPPHPDHPRCQCGLFPVAVANPALVSLALSAAIDAGAGVGLQGLFNQDWATGALLSGAFETAAEAAREF
jgi:hypothetical protein